MPNTTMIYVTHDQVEAMTLADRIVVLKEGKHRAGRHADGTLSSRPGNLFVAQFIGSPAMNILPATINATGKTTEITVGVNKVSVPIGTPSSAQGSTISFGVRPEDLRLAKGKDHIFEGTIDYIEQLGEVQLVYVDIGRTDQPLTAKLPGNATIKRGDVLRLDADGGDLHIFDGNGSSFVAHQPASKAA